MKGLLAIVSLLAVALWVAQTPRPSKVVLSWSAPASSPDPVVGYNVYRANTGSSAFVKLNATPVTATTYTDTTIEAGATYTYYVVSVDAQGNQSTPSAYWLWPTRPQSPYVRWFRRHIRRVLLLVMLLAITGLVALLAYAARMGRARRSAARWT